MSEQNQSISRRGIIQAGVLAGVGLAAGEIRAADVTARGKAFRVAHLTDMHVTPGPTRSGEGYTLALQSLAKLSPKPDLLLTGGDHIMDSLEHPRNEIDAMWDLYLKTFKDNTDLPSHPVVGNHDVYGWGLEAAKLSPDTAEYGKALYCDKMSLVKPYYSFDAGVWHFICLDNISHADPKGYWGGLDPEQAAWLKTDLEATPTQMPICVLTHIPILAVCTYFFAAYKGKTYTVGNNMMHDDANTLITLLASHNVKLCISGHVHMVDRVSYRGITFICDGAVSGNWWKGRFHEFDEGYGVFDFYSDGTFEHGYQNYGWQAQKV